MKTMSVTAFKARFLELVEQIRTTGKAVKLTKRGKPIVYVAPLTHDGEIDFTPGRCANTVTHVGDVMSPVVDESEFDLEKKWF